ncbi:uncharacterized protein LOC105689483 [Athalia rosae]|uniref:uncharacterized protein LOC105689483 n=1 Tax=Athalia rosae TaxID=37344 RepID=UPI002033FB2F|nr:uncharacterized protein LOC105689483 [Athalia rosae]
MYIRLAFFCIAVCGMAIANNVEYIRQQKVTAPLGADPNFDLTSFHHNSGHRRETAEELQFLPEMEQVRLQTDEPPKTFKRSPNDDELSTSTVAAVAPGCCG